MDDSLWVDPDLLDRLSSEFRSMADELQDRAQRFTARCTDFGDAYGTLPQGHDASRTYADVVDSMSRHLEQRIAEHHAQADTLAQAAARFRSGQQHALDAIADMSRPGPAA